MNQEVQHADSGEQPEFNDAAETEAWQALQGELDSEPGISEPEPTTAGDREPEAAETAGDQRGEDGGKPTPEQLTSQYQAAMREERQHRQQEQQRRQQLEAQINEINQAIAEARQQRQQPQDEPPSIDEDPVAYFEHQNRQLQEQLEAQQQYIEQDASTRQQVQQHQQFVAALGQSEESYAQQAPDYYDATEHLRNHRMEQLEVLYPSTPEAQMWAQQQGFQSVEAMRHAHLENEVMMFASQAMQSGRNPAEVFYSLAKSTGWNGARPQQVSPQIKADVARAGARRSLTLSGGGGSGRATDNATASELSDLYLTDPEAADALFDKLAASGALG